MNIQEQAEIAAALAVGDVVQCRRGEDCKWERVTAGHIASGLNFRAFLYRIRPEPIVVYLNHYVTPNPDLQWSPVYLTAAAAIQGAEASPETPCDKIALPFRFMTTETDPFESPEHA